MAYELEQEQYTAPINRGLLMRLLRYLSPHKGKAALATLLMLGISGVTVVGPYITKVLIDDYIVVGDITGLNRIALLMVLLFVSSWLLSYWRGIVMATMGQRIIYGMRQEV